MKQKQLHFQVQNTLMGMRVPKDFFATKGKGESDITRHAGSYHLALKDAGIEMCNIMTYSSILPGIATEIERPPTLTHGAVMESIVSEQTSSSGERATAGIIYGWLFDRKTGQKYGGLVCERNGTFSEQKIKAELRASLNELYYNGFSEQFEMRDVYVHVQSFMPRKKFGTALVALCFTNYVYPVIKEV
ncbi:hypothetical protein J4419_02405 [Candidatus Woesearchaeota archaeon]|nr:hypothetical protein [Candidatus Woesearchaeota archaeon]